LDDKEYYLPGLDVEEGADVPPINNDDKTVACDDNPHNDILLRSLHIEHNSWHCHVHHVGEIRLDTALDGEAIRLYGTGSTMDER
jgi:hypothetical protein